MDLQPDKANAMIGKLQDRYRVLAKLGSGGMADVFLGVQLGEEQFNRLVVIKRVHGAWLMQNNVQRMFVDEARTIASLSHPHIVKIFDLSKLNSDICIAMEYVDGETLDYVRKAITRLNLRIPLKIVLKLILEACEALHYAHFAQTPDSKPLHLIHRDVGPHNLILSRSGYLKVIDFGIAKSEAQSDLTSPGTLKGKLAYMAPDLFRYKDIDHRVDLYALGLVLFELVTLKRAVSLEKDALLAKVIDKIINDGFPQPSEIVPDLPPEIDAIVGRALEKDRDRRYQSGEEFADDIRKLGESTIGIATTSEVAQWFHQTFAERIAKRKDFERKAMEMANTIVKSVSDNLEKMMVLSAERGPDSLGPAVTDPGNLKPLSDGSYSSAKGQRTKLLIALLGGLILALFAVAVLIGVIIAKPQSSQESSAPQTLTRAAVTTPPLPAPAPLANAAAPLSGQAEDIPPPVRDAPATAAKPPREIAALPAKPAPVKVREATRRLSAREKALAARANRGVSHSAVERRSSPAVPPESPAAEPALPPVSAPAAASGERIAVAGPPDDPSSPPSTGSPGEAKPAMPPVPAPPAAQERTRPPFPSKSEGSVLILSQVPGHIFIDGKNTGKLTPWRFTLPEGDHEIVVLLKDSNTRIKHLVKIKLGKLIKLNIREGD